MIAFTRWPEEFAARYRQKGYWQDLPLTNLITRHAENDAVAIIDGERQISYRQFNQLVDNLACSLQRQGLKRGETALVQLGNVAEFYMTFFALLRIGVAPVNALFSHQRSELNAYAAQIKPALLIADREHALFADDSFLHAFIAEHPSLRVALLRNDGGERDLATEINRPADNFIANPTPADEVAFFQLSGGSTGTPKLIPRTHNDYDYSIRRSNEICGINAETRYLNALPAAHNYAMSSPGSLGVFLAGGRVILAADPSATLCFPLIEKHQINVASLVPPAVSLWLQAIHEWGILFKNRTSFCIVSLALLGIVLGTVQLDHKPCLCTVKVNDKGLNDPLLVDFYRIIAQKQIPKLSLLRSRCAAQSACSAKHFIIFVDCGVFHERLPLR